MSVRSRPRLEPLDHRVVPALFGNAWPSGNLTLSFAPDGTDVNGVPSELSKAFVSIPTDVWQREVLRAFQTWAINANVNVGLVTDDGQPFGTAGAIAGDSRFGDIRIAAGPLAPDAIALGMPFSVTAGTRSGDVWFNSSQPFVTAGTAGYDLFSVALHEAGHVFGLSGSIDPASAMYQLADRPRTDLSPADLAGFLTLYPARSPDDQEGQTGNDTLANATAIHVGSGKTGIATVMGDVTTAADRDVFRFKSDDLTAPDGITVSVQVARTSLLVPKLELLDAAGNVVATAIGSAPGSGDVSLHLAGVAPESTYYARLSGGTADIFGIGGYKLDVRPDTVPAEPDDPNRPLNPDAGTNDTIGTAEQLGQDYLQAGPKFDYQLGASLNTPTDVDVYRLRSPQGPGNSAGPLTASVWSGMSGSDPVIEIFDTRGMPVAAQVLVHDGGSFTLQVPDAVANVDYHVIVRHAHPGPAAVPGNYHLGVDFGGAVVELTDFAVGTITPAAQIVVQDLTVTEAEVLHLVFGSSPVPDAAIRLTLLDAAHKAVASRYAVAGDVGSLNVFLKPGTYHVLIAGASTSGTAYPGVDYFLSGLPESDPIGPLPVDPTMPGAVPPVVVTIPPIPTVDPVGTVTPEPLPTPVPPIDPTLLAWWIAPPTDWPVDPLLTLVPLPPPVVPPTIPPPLPPPTTPPTSPPPPVIVLPPPAPPPVPPFVPPVTVSPPPPVPIPPVTVSPPPTAGPTGTSNPPPIGKAPPPPGPLLVGGAGDGSALLLNPANGILTTGTAISFPGLIGAIHTSLADITGDGTPDYVGASGPGQAAQVVILDGISHQVVASFQPFGSSYTGGAFVATADFTGDGKAELVVGPDLPGMGPRMVVYDGASFGSGSTVPVMLSTFLGLASLSGEADASFLGGGRVGVSDVTGDGTPDLIVGAGNTGGPRITVWDGKGFAGAGGGQPRINPVANLFVFEPTQRDGAYVASGDVTGDGVADLVFGGGPGGGPRIRIVDGAKLLTLPNLEAVNLDDTTNLTSGLVLNNFFAGDPNARGGVRVALRTVDGDNLADLIAGSGDGEPSSIRVYLGTSLAAVRGQDREPALAQVGIAGLGDILTSGVFVG